MISYFKKFVGSFANDPYETLCRSFRFALRMTKRFAENVLFRLILPIVSVAPCRTKVLLKSKLDVRVRLDYPRSPISLVAESEVSLRRSVACLKEPETVQWIEKNLEAGDVFYDIGANVGAYSLIAAKQGRAAVKIFAFEPSFSTYDQLCRNVINNDCQGVVFPYLAALTEVTERVRFEYRSLTGGVADHMTVFPHGDGASFTPVYTQNLLGFSLDHLVEKFDFPFPMLMKLDVDGAEIPILRGASNALRSPQLRSILVEVRDEGDNVGVVTSILAEAGFVLAERHDRGDGVVWNYIFSRATHQAG